MTERSFCPATALRRLYFARFGFAVVWAALLVLTATAPGPVAWTLLVIYPLFDVAAAVLDFRSGRSRLLILNMAISAVAAVGLGFAAASGVPAALRVWGAWAVLSGLVQLIVALYRRGLGAQVPMMLSGAISVLAGGSFIAMAGTTDPKLTNLAGYAILGGVFFLISALRLGRAARTASPVGGR